MAAVPRPVWPMLRRVVGALPLLVLLSLVCSSGCGGDRAASPAADGAAASRGPSRGGPADLGDDDRPVVVALGDSLTAGLGLSTDAAWPALVQNRIDAEGYRYRVANMGVSGDTTAGGLRRLEWALDDRARVLIVALGANDGLRGLSPDAMKANLAGIIDLAHDRGLSVLLCGMEAPPNFGPAYTRRFRAVYADLAREKRVELLPFLLDGVAGLAEYNQTDGIHPNAAGASRVADLVWAKLQPMLDALPEPAP